VDWKEPLFGDVDNRLFNDASHSLFLCWAINFRLR